jgi:serine/threonine-protein kinase RsbW
VTGAALGMTETHRLDVRPSLDDLGRVRDFIEASAGAADLAADRIGELVLAVDEAVSNIVMHGGGPNAGRIEIRVLRGPDRVLVQIRDECIPFDPTRPDEQHLGQSPLERDQPGGFGLNLLNRLVDRVDYRVAEDGRNELALVKRR